MLNHTLKTFPFLVIASLLAACDPNAQTSSPLTDSSGSPTNQRVNNETSTGSGTNSGSNSDRNRDVNDNTQNNSGTYTGSTSGSTTGGSGTGTGQGDIMAGSLSLDLDNAAAIGVGVVNTSNSTLTINPQGQLGGPVDGALSLPNLNESGLSLNGTSEEQLLTRLDSDGSARGIRLPRRTDNNTSTNVLSVNRAGTYGTMIEVSEGRYFNGTPIALVDGDGRVRPFPIPGFTSSNVGSACQLQTNERGDVAMSVNKQLFVYRFPENEFKRISNINTFATDFLLMEDGAVVYTTRQNNNGNIGDDILRVQNKAGSDAEFLPSVSGGITALIHSRMIGQKIVRQSLVSELQPNSTNFLYWSLPFEIAVERQPAASSQPQCFHDRPHNADALPSLANGWTASRTDMQGFGQGNIAANLRQWGYKGPMAYNVGGAKVTDIPFAAIGPANHLARAGGDFSSFDMNSGKYFDGKSIVELELAGFASSNDVSAKINGVFPIRYGKLSSTHPSDFRVQRVFGPNHGFTTVWWALVNYGSSSRGLAPIDPSTGILDVSKIQSLTGLNETMVSLYRLAWDSGEQVRIVLANKRATSNIPLLSFVTGLNANAASTLSLTAINMDAVQSSCPNPSKKFLRGINNGAPQIAGAASMFHLIAGCTNEAGDDLSTSVVRIIGNSESATEIIPARIAGERSDTNQTCARQLISYPEATPFEYLMIRPCDSNGVLQNTLNIVSFTNNDFTTPSAPVSLPDLVPSDVLSTGSDDHYEESPLYSPRVAIARGKLGNYVVIARRKSYTNSGTTYYGRAYLIQSGFTEVDAVINISDFKTEGMQRIGVGLDPMEDTRGSGDTLETFQSKYYMANWGETKILVAGVKPIVMSGDTPLPHQYETRLFDTVTRQETSLKWAYTDNNMPMKVNSAVTINTGSTSKVLLNVLDPNSGMSRNIHCTLDGQCINPDHSETVKIVNAVKRD
jgi:hypothetical protein